MEGIKVGKLWHHCFNVLKMISDLDVSVSIRLIHIMRL